MHRHVACTLRCVPCCWLCCPTEEQQEGEKVKHHNARMLWLWEGEPKPVRACSVVFFFPRVSPLCNRLLSHIHAKSLRRQGWESILKSTQRLAALKNQPSSSNYVCFAHPSMDLWSLSYPLNQMSATQELSSRTSPTTHTGEPAEPQPGQPHERLWRGRSRTNTLLFNCYAADRQPHTFMPGGCSTFWILSVCNLLYTKVAMSALCYLIKLCWLWIPEALCQRSKWLTYYRC